MLPHKTLTVMRLLTAMELQMNRPGFSRGPFV